MRPRAAEVRGRWRTVESARWEAESSSLVEGLKEPGDGNPQRTKTYHGWFVLVGCFLATLSFGLFFSYGVFYTPLFREFGWTKAQTGSIIAVATLVQTLCSLPIGWLTDRFGPRKVLLLGSFLLGLGALLSASSSTLWQWYLFYGLIGGAGWAVTASVPLNVAVRWFPHGRAIATGVTTSGSGIGGTAFPAISAFLIDLYGWRGTIDLLGLLFSGLVLVSASILKFPREPVSRENGPDVRGKVSTKDWTVRQVIRRRAIWLLFLLFALPSFNLFIVYTYLPPLGIARGMTPIVAAEAVGLLGAVSIAARLGSFLFVRKLGTVTSLTLATAIMSLSTLVSLTSLSLVVFYAFAALYGLGYGLWISLMASATGEILGQTHYGQLWGFVNIGAGVGGVSGPIAAGAFLDRGGSDIFVLPMAGAAAGIGTILGLILRKTTKATSVD